jgi:3-deoxy-manno-octulosonate cytidylyltransferase (CMP-KDO synthetase)
MIEHVFRRAAMCDVLDAVYVATCDEEIRRVAEGFGAPVLMTSSTHERASDRVAEAAASLGADIVVMIQGDEPMITPGMIASAVGPMIEDDTVRLVNLTRRIGAWEEYADRNTIKVVMDLNWNALYFSRAPIPTLDSAGVERGEAFKQVCVIPFRHEFLREFTRLPQTPLERAESIDMLRAVENGARVRMAPTEVDTHAVDTAEDLRLVESLMKDDPLVLRYEISRMGAKV